MQNDILEFRRDSARAFSIRGRFELISLNFDQAGRRDIAQFHAFIDFRCRNMDEISLFLTWPRLLSR